MKQKSLSFVEWSHAALEERQLITHVFHEREGNPAQQRQQINSFNSFIH